MTDSDPALMKVQINLSSVADPDPYHFDTDPDAGKKGISTRKS